MTNSKQLAKLIGPTLIALSVSEMMNPPIWVNVPATQTYLAGVLWFIAGLSIVRGHNIWMAGWPLMITLIGWLGILGGLGRMFFPKPVQQGSENSSIVLALQIVLLAIGLALTFKAYSGKNSKPGPVEKMSGQSHDMGI